MILFFVRSGLLTSIHSFAVDAERGLLLFGILSMITLVVFLVCFKNYGFWSPHLSLRPAEVFGEGVGGNLQKWYHNEGRSPRRLRLLVMTRMLFSVQTLCIWMAILSLLLAIIYPLLAEQWGQTISISPFYFQATFIPLSLPILLSMGLAPWMTKMPAAAMTTTLAVWVGLFWWAQSIPLFGLIILSATVWIVISHLYFILKTGFKNLGMVLAHLGLGIAVMGMVISTYGTQQSSLSLTVGDKPLPVGDTGWHISLQQVHTQPGPNYTARQAVINIYDTQGRVVTTLKPERRYFTAAKVIHTEAAFYSTGWSHLYMVLLNDDQTPYRVQADYKPFINLLWFGVLMMVIGGGLAAINRWRKKRGIDTPSL